MTMLYNPTLQFHYVVLKKHISTRNANMVNENRSANSVVVVKSVNMVNENRSANSVVVVHSVNMIHENRSANSVVVVQSVNMVNKNRCANSVVVVHSVNMIHENRSANSVVVVQSVNMVNKNRSANSVVVVHCVNMVNKKRGALNVIRWKHYKNIEDSVAYVGLHIFPSYDGRRKCVHRAIKRRLIAPKYKSGKCCYCWCTVHLLKTIRCLDKRAMW